MSQESIFSLPSSGLLTISKDLELESDSLFSCTTRRTTPSLFLQHLHRKIIDSANYIMDGIQDIQALTPHGQLNLEGSMFHAMEVIRLSEHLLYMQEFKKKEALILSNQPFNLMEVLEKSIENLHWLFNEYHCDVSFRSKLSTSYCIGDAEVLGTIFETLLSALASDHRKGSPSSLVIDLEIKQIKCQTRFKLQFHKPYSIIFQKRLAAPLSAQIQNLKNLLRHIGALLYPFYKNDQQSLILECFFETALTEEIGNFNINSAVNEANLSSSFDELPSPQAEKKPIIEKTTSNIAYVPKLQQNLGTSKYMAEYEHKIAKLESHRKFLIVEGNPFMQQQIRLLFKLFNHVDLMFASDNADALFHYRNTQKLKEYFDLIFLDREVVTLNHRDICAFIRKEDQTQVILSFSSTKSHPSNYKELGYDECVNKPLEYEALKYVLGSWLKIGQERRLKYYRKIKQQLKETNVISFNDAHDNSNHSARPYPSK